MTHHTTHTTKLPRLISLRQTAELTGYTVKALNQKIDKGQLPERIVWTKCPSRRRWINIRNLMLWFEHRLFY